MMWSTSWTGSPRDLMYPVIMWTPYLQYQNLCSLIYQVTVGFSCTSAVFIKLFQADQQPLKPVSFSICHGQTVIFLRAGFILIKSWFPSPISRYIQHNVVRKQLPWQHKKRGLKELRKALASILPFHNLHTSINPSPHLFSNEFCSTFSQKFWSSFCVGAK